MNDFRIYQGMDFSGFLVHYGVGHDQGGHSGRYPWGSGAKGKKREVSSVEKREKSRNKLHTVTTKSKNKASVPRYIINALIAGRNFAARRLVERGSAQRIYKYRNYLTNEEIEAAIKRLDLQKSLNNVNRLQKEKAMKTFESFFIGLSTVAKYVDTASTLRNSIANFADSGKRSPSRQDLTPYTTKQARDIMSYIQTNPNISQSEFDDFMKMLKSVSTIEQYTNGKFNTDKKK